MNHKKEYIVLFVACVLASTGLYMGEPVYGIGAFIQFCTGVAIWYAIIMVIVKITTRVKKTVSRLINNIITTTKKTKKVEHKEVLCLLEKY